MSEIGRTTPGAQAVTVRADAQVARRDRGRGAAHAGAGQGRERRLRRATGSPPRCSPASRVASESCWPPATSAISRRHSTLASTHCGARRSRRSRYDRDSAGDGWHRVHRPVVHRRTSAARISGPTLTPGLPAYRRSKTLAERSAWEFIQNNSSTTTLTTVLPGAVFGAILDTDNVGSVQVIGRLLSGRMRGTPRVGLEVVGVRDIADVHIRAMTEPQAAGRTLLGNRRVRLDARHRRDAARTPRRRRTASADPHHPRLRGAGGGPVRSVIAVHHTGTRAQEQAHDSQGGAAARLAAAARR